MIPSLPDPDALQNDSAEIQRPIQASEISVMEFVETPSETALDLNFSQRGSQNLPKAQAETNGLQQEAHMDITSPHIGHIGDDGAATANGFDSPAQKTRSGNLRLVASQHKSRCHWTHAEIIALFDAKKAQTDRIEQGLKKTRASSSGKWEEISDFCKSLGVNKVASQCRDKWERLWPNFKKILDWDRQTPEGKPGYWAMTEDQREQEGFPRLFDKELFDAMSARFDITASLNISPSVIKVNGDLGEPSSAANAEGWPDASNDPNKTETCALDDAPPTLDNHVLRTSRRKRKTPDRFGVVTPAAPNSNKKGNILLEAKEEDGITSSKDGQTKKSKGEPLDLVERRLQLEERKLKLAERRFSLEERKLEATIDIGKGLIASMERMSSTISSLSSMPFQEQ